MNVVSLQENAFKDMAVAQMQRQLSTAKLTSDLYELLERESGAYSIDQLYRRLNAQAMGHEFEDFNVHVRELINRGVLVLNPQQKVWLRAKVPPQTRPSAQERPSKPDG